MAADEGLEGAPVVLEPAEAARVLAVRPEVLEALVDAGFLRGGFGVDGRSVALTELKSFAAKNSPDDELVIDVDLVDPEDLLDALDGRVDEMAQRSLDIFSEVFPESRTWSNGERDGYLAQSRARFQAIVAVTAMGEQVDPTLLAELEGVGSNAAHEGAPLPELLVALRISRDLMVQTAVEIAEHHGRHWRLALSLVLTRILPAIDQLTDSVARGWWNELVHLQEQGRARWENLVIGSSDGIYEVDPDARVSFANAALASMVGRELDEIIGRSVAEVFRPCRPDGGDPVVSLTCEEAGLGTTVELEVLRTDGTCRSLEIHTVGRWVNRSLVGFQGIARDVTDRS